MRLGYTNFNHEILSNGLISTAKKTDFRALEGELPLINIGDKTEISPFSISDYLIQGKVIEINPTIDKNGIVKIKSSIESTQKNYTMR